MKNVNKARLTSATIFVLLLGVLVGCSLKGPDGPDEPQVQAPPIPLDLNGRWEGTLTWLTNPGEENPQYETFPIEFDFTDSTYASYGARLHASGIYDRYDDTVVILHNDLFYEAIWDLRRLPAAYYPLEVWCQNDILSMTATGVTASPYFRGWQRIVLVRTDE
jgi:hypothetical protein